MDAYRTPTQPTPQRKPRMEWSFDVDRVSLEEPHVALVAEVVGACALFVSVIVSSGAPFLARVVLGTAAATLAWCACFVRRREVTP